MNLSISNLAWDVSDDLGVGVILKELAISNIEIAPSKIWEAPINTTKDQLESYKFFWANQGVSIVAIQSLLYGRPDLILFGDSDTRARLKAYLSHMMYIAAYLGARILVFGSPKNRVIDNMGKEQVIEISVEFFSDLAKIAENCGVVLCIEPNPDEYGCNFVTNTKEGIDLVKQVNMPGFRLHLDAGAMALAGEKPDFSISAAIMYLEHFHISEPYLKCFNHENQIHKLLASALVKNKYENSTSIEMVLPSAGDKFTTIYNAIKEAQNTYYLIQ